MWRKVGSKWDTLQQLVDLLNKHHPMGRKLGLVTTSWSYCIGFLKLEVFWSTNMMLQTLHTISVKYPKICRSIIFVLERTSSSSVLWAHTWGQFVQSPPSRAWKLGLTTSRMVPSPKYQIYHGCLHGNTFERWALELVFRIGSSKN
jgi:hypothetical protein